MATALALAASAYKQANLDQDLTSFSMTDFPYSISLDLFNTVIREMNRKGHYWFMEEKTAILYSVGVYQYSYSGLSVDPKGILRIRKELAGSEQELTQINRRNFEQRFRRTPIQSGEPRYWTKYDGQIEFDVIPDQDYSLKVYHLKNIPLITTTTDTLDCGESNEDVFQEGIYAYLLNRLGRGDWKEAMAIWLEKVSALLADMKQDVGIPRQLPAAF